jgi:hydrogenase expression/formation protein HypC
MCLGIPGRIVESDGLMAKVDVGGTKKEASLMLLDDVAVGDYVIVHAGFAIQKVDEQEAEESLKVVDEIIKGMDVFYEE